MSVELTHVLFGVCKGDGAGKVMEEYFSSVHSVLIPSRANAVWEAGPYYLTPITSAFEFTSAPEQCTKLGIYRESADMALSWGCRLQLQ